MRCDPSTAFRLIAAFGVLVSLGASLLLAPHSQRTITDADLGVGYIGYDGVDSATSFLVVPDQLVEPAHDSTGSVHGTLVDDSDLPIRGLEVELIPLDKTNDQRWYATKREWTNAQGEYTFSGVDGGDYIVAVQKRGAPDARHPYVGTYYPGVEDESSADRILIVSSSTSELHPVRLRRVETVTIKITVVFEDGSRPAWSNLLFHNPSFPDQAVIGDEAPGVENGEGEFTVPTGFEYYAQAKVDCDAGPRIETRESRPIQRVRIEKDRYPQELAFIIPGPPCTLWTPKP